MQDSYKRFFTKQERDIQQLELHKTRALSFTLSREIAPEGSIPKVYTTIEGWRACLGAIEKMLYNHIFGCSAYEKTEQPYHSCFTPLSSPACFSFNYGGRYLEGKLERGKALKLQSHFRCL